LFSQICSAFPDVKVSVDDLVAENDKVTLRWSSEGTHSGELNGIAPTKRRVAMTGIAIYRFDEGRIVEAWNNSDSLGMLRQLGVVP
jgi:predicted ester cyclase